MKLHIARTLAPLALACFACSSDESSNLDGGGAGADSGVEADASGSDGGDLDGGDLADAGAMDATEPDAGFIDPTENPFETIRDRGDPARKVDIVFVGDGYTLEQLATEYVNDVNKLAEGMFRDVNNNVTEPFRRYRDYFNVHRVHVASNESGIDEGGTEVDTAFDGRDNCGGFGAQCFVNATKVHDAVDAALAGSGITPDWVVAVLNTESEVSGIVESPRGNIAVYAGKFGGEAFNGYRARELGMRELARAFCNVGYEYVGQGNAYTGSEPPFVNLTTTATAPKWARWDGYDERRDGLTAVGSYEGGDGFETGLYRPTEESKMGAHSAQNTLRFNAVTREAIILALYEIVPLVISQNPPAGETQTDPVVLYIETAGNPTVEWAIDGVVVAGQNGPAFGITDHARIEGIPAGTYTVTARVFDDTDWVRVEPRTGMEETLTWTVELTGS